MATYRQLKDFEQTCPICGKTRIVWRSNKNRAQVCRSCASTKANLARPTNGPIELTCIDCGQTRIVAKLSTKARTPIRCKPCAVKESKNRPEVRAKMSARFSGAGSNFWRGGVTPANEKARRSLQYREWRRAVFTRDAYTCQLCWLIGGRLNADHIQPWALHPDLRYDVSNGRTLCEPCHRDTATYGHRLQRRVTQGDHGDCPGHLPQRTP